MTKGRKDLENPRSLATVVESLEKEELDKIGWREHLTLSETARRAIQEYIKNHAEGNDTFKITKWQEDPNFQAVPALSADKEKWIQYYKDSNDKDRTDIRIYANEILKVAKMVDFNENRK
jgi:hypothetical protein